MKLVFYVQKIFVEIAHHNVFVDIIIVIYVLMNVKNVEGELVINAYLNVFVK